MNDLQPFKQTGPFQAKVLAAFFTINAVLAAVICPLFLYMSVVGFLSPQVFASPVVPFGLLGLAVVGALVGRFSLRTLIRRDCQEFRVWGGRLNMFRRRLG